MIYAGLPMATPNMAQLSNTIGSMPADPQETALSQYIQQLAAQGQTGTPQYLIAGGELQHRQNLREEHQAQQAAGVMQQPPVMQQLAQGPQMQQMQPQMQAQGQAATTMPTMPNPAQSMQNQLGATPAVQPGIMDASQAGGIETLPAENLQNIENYAGGGIVAFDDGGEVPGYKFGGKVTAMLAAQPEQDTARQAALRERLRGLYDQGQTALPADFFKPEDFSGKLGKLKAFFNNTIKKDLAQKELDKMWADKNKSDIADYFKSGVRLDEEDVKKYNLAGGGVVAFDKGGMAGTFDMFTPEQFPLRDPKVDANLDDLSKILEQHRINQQKMADIFSGRTVLDKSLTESRIGPKAAAELIAQDELRKQDVAPKKETAKTPAADKVDAGIAALSKAFGSAKKEPTLGDISKERLDYYKTLGIGGDPYAELIKRAEAKVGPEQEAKDKKRMFWETIGILGSGLGEAASKQTNKRAQFAEDLSRGFRKALEKAPEGLREIEKLKEGRQKSLDELQLAKFNYAKSGADSDLKRLDDKSNRVENYNLKILDMQANAQIERLKNEGVINERQAKREFDIQKAAAELALSSLKNATSLQPDTPEYEAELRRRTTLFSKRLRENADSAGSGSLQQSGKGTFTYVPNK